MVQITISDEDLKRVIKEAVKEAIQEFVLAQPTGAKFDVDGTTEEVSNRYNMPGETVAQMRHDGVILGQLLTPEQVAHRFQTKPKTIYKLVRTGELPVHRLKGSRMLRFDPFEIEARKEIITEGTAPVGSLTTGAKTATATKSTTKKGVKK